MGIYTDGCTCTHHSMSLTAMTTTEPSDLIAAVLVGPCFWRQSSPLTNDATSTQSWNMVCVCV